MCEYERLWDEILLLVVLCVRTGDTEGRVLHVRTAPLVGLLEIQYLGLKISTENQ